MNLSPSNRVIVLSLAGIVALGKEICTYKHMRTSPKAVNFIPVVNWFARGADVKTKEVVILFEGNVVTKYTMRETDDQVKQGSAQ